MMDVLTKLVVGIILQYIRVSNHHVAYLKLTQCYVHYNSIKLVDKRKPFPTFEII